MTFELNADQQKQYDAVIKLCTDIEGEMRNHIEATDPQEVQAQLSTLLPYLSNLSDMVSVATEIFNWAKGEAASIAMSDSRVLGLKAEVQKKWFSGKLAKYDALYERVQSVEKNLRSSIEGLRTLLSYEKELIRNRIQQEQQQTH